MLVHVRIPSLLRREGGVYKLEVGLGTEKLCMVVAFLRRNSDFKYCSQEWSVLIRPN